MTRRIFVSIDLPVEAKEQLKLRQKHEVRWIKWMKLDNLHITLNFLGELNTDDIETAKSVIRDTVPYYQPFNLRIPGTRAERDMLWLVPAENNRLDELQAEFKAKFKEHRIGKRERHKYAPHILYAKSKTGRPMLWQPENWEPIEFTVDRINLYDSELTPGAATHRLIESFKLT